MIDTTVSYTHTYKATNSSVIERVWWSSDTEDMYVELKRGPIYGYEQVPRDVYEAFVAQEKLGGSIGQYWNEWIKPHMSGFGEIDENTIFTLDVTEQEPVEEAPSLFGAFADQFPDLTDAQVDTVGEPEVVRTAITPEYLRDNSIPVSEYVKGDEPAKVRNEYRVTFTYDSKGGSFTFTMPTTAEWPVYSDTAENAIAAFGQAVDALGLAKVKIKSVTMYFND